MLTAADQTAIIAAMPGAKTATVAAGSFLADFRTESEPIQYSDGSIEVGKPYCIATAADVVVHLVDLGTAITLDPIEWENNSFWDETWYVIAMRQHQDGMYRLTLSKEP